jgi:hypothetical protein
MAREERRYRDREQELVKIDLTDYLLDFLVHPNVSLPHVFLEIILNTNWNIKLWYFSGLYTVNGQLIFTVGQWPVHVHEIQYAGKPLIQ